MDEKSETLLIKRLKMVAYEEPMRAVCEKPRDKVAGAGLEDVIIPSS